MIWRYLLLGLLGTAAATASAQGRWQFFNADEPGADGSDLKRRSTVSLVHPQLGELRVGRDSVATVREWAAYDPFQDAGVGRATRLAVAGALAPGRAETHVFKRNGNAVSLALPGSLGGVFAQVTAAGAGAVDDGIGEGVGNAAGSSGRRYAGLRAGYGAHGLQVSASAGRTQLGSATSADTWTVGAAVALSAVRLSALWSSLDAGPASQRNWLLGASVPLGGVEWRVAYQAMAGEGRIAGRQASMSSVGAVLPLSPRSALVGTVSAIANQGTAFGVAADVAQRRGQDVRSAELGFRHAF